MARQNMHPLGKPEGLSLSDLMMMAEPAAYLTLGGLVGNFFEHQLLGLGC